jgi:hypothetical protein
MYLFICLLVVYLRNDTVNSSLYVASTDGSLENYQLENKCKTAVVG